MPESNSISEATELIRKSRRILIMSHQKPDADAVGSVLATLKFLRNLDKETEAHLPDGVPESLRFLPGSSNVNTEIRAGHTLLIELDTARHPISSLSYDTEAELLRVMIEPKQSQSIPPSAVQVHSGRGGWDLVIILDTERIGALGVEPPNAPILNIDHHQTNQRFGALNLINPTTSSTAELLLELFSSIDSEKLDAEIATCLYAGLLSDTGGFQNPQTSARSLKAGSRLLELGAASAEVNRALTPGTRDPGRLRLCGQALSNLRHEEETGLVWTRVDYPAFLDEGNPTEWGGGELIDSMIRGVDGAKLVAMLTERSRGKVNVSLRVPPGLDSPPDASRLAAYFGGGGHAAAAAFQRTETMMDEVIAEILPVIRTFLSTGTLPEAPTSGSAEPRAGETPGKSRPERPISTPTSPRSPFEGPLPSSDGDRRVGKGQI